MKLAHILTACAATALSACGEKPASIAEVESCQSDALEGSVDIAEYGATLRIRLTDNSKSVPLKSGGYFSHEFFREGFAGTEDQTKATTVELVSEMNAFCRTGEFPENEGISFEKETPNEYECRGDSLNIAKIELHGEKTVLYTGNAELAVRDDSNTVRPTYEQTQGYVSKKANVYGYEEAREIAREHCQAPAPTTP